MNHTAKRVEMLRLIKQLQQPDESPGNTIVRALEALRSLPSVETVRDEWCAEYVVLRDALQFIADGYANQNVNHLDYRVKVYQTALSALSSTSRATPAEGE